MKTIYTPKPESSRIIILSLFSIIIAIILLVIIGSIFALVRPADADPILRLGRQHGTRQTRQAAEQKDDVRVFSGLGRLRIPLSNSSTMLLSISFPYPANDTAFTEELAAKIGEFRNIATAYFSSLPEQDLININENIAKSEILRRFNGILRLGRIEALYFNDMMIIDTQL